MAGRAIRAYAASLTDLTAIVGSRIRPGHGEELDGARDYITYQQIDGEASGDLEGPDGLTVDLYQVSLVAAGGGPSDYARVRLMARLLAGTKDDERLNGFRGTIGGIVVQSCKLVSQRDIQNEPASGEGRGRAEIQQDYRIAWEESAATVPG